MDDPTLSKTCPRCGVTQALDLFGRDRSRRDGLTSWCKSCKRAADRAYAQTAQGKANRNARSRRYAQAHPDRVAAAGRAWREKHPGYSAEANRKWRAANPGAAAAYYAENRERLVEQHRAWLERNAARKAETDRAWAEANADKRSASARKWQIANPEKAREIAQRRRARQRATTVGPVDLEALWAESRGLCGICLDPIDATLRYPERLSASLDHIVPLAKGGTHEQANLQWAHLVCNNRKGATVPDNSPHPRSESLDRGIS